MWTKLSLRARLSLPMVAMVLAALALGGVALQIVSPDQFEYENAQASRSTKAVAAALNAALAVSTNPQATLEAFAQGLGRPESIEFRLPAPDKPRVRVEESLAPRWFIALLRIPEIGAAYPITIEGKHVGDIVFAPDLSADVFEKWIGFLAIVFSGSALMLMAALSAYFTTGTAIHPLAQLRRGLAALRAGDYDSVIPLEGPPEIRKSCEAANQLAATLKGLSRDNRNLLHKLVSVQDDERRELAQELHDELGPLLFAIRANATVLSESSPAHAEPHSPAQGMLQAAEALQQANRRILERLSPLYVQDLELGQSIATLLQNARSQAPQLKLTAEVDPRLNDIDGVLSQTIYRVIQEGVTNVLRHAKANTADVRAAIDDDQVAIEISDDGVGFSPDNAFGRGLTGMRERVRALDGTFALLRENGRTIVCCRLPLEPVTAGQAPSADAGSQRS
jgi:two-component system, NarL family, sensor histidine kinase UhpB